MALPFPFRGEHEDGEEALRVWCWWADGGRAWVSERGTCGFDELVVDEGAVGFAPEFDEDGEDVDRE